MKVFRFIKRVAKKLFWRAWWQFKRTVTLRRFQTVVLLGRNGVPFNSAYVPWKVHEIWGASYAHKYHSNVNRTFVMDHPRGFRNREIYDEYAQSINEQCITFTSSVVWHGMNKNDVFDLPRIRRELNLPDYYVSSVAYMIAEAIREGFGRIIVHEILAGFLSLEYIDQKACLDWWAGYALGRGIEVITSEHCLIGKPYWWQTELYGYVSQETSDDGQEIMSKAYRDAVRLPLKFQRAPLTDKL